MSMAKLAFGVSALAVANVHKMEFLKPYSSTKNNPHFRL